QLDQPVTIVLERLVPFAIPVGAEDVEGGACCGGGVRGHGWRFPKMWIWLCCVGLCRRLRGWPMGIRWGKHLSPRRRAPTPPSIGNEDLLAPWRGTMTKDRRDLFAALGFLLPNLLGFLVFVAF